MTDPDFTRLEAVAGQVSRETYAELRDLQAFFETWASRINLVASSTLPDLWERHILDSAQLFRLAPEARLWIDLGSGGGFPGVVIAVLVKGRGQGHVHLVESNAKKSAYLRAASVRFQLPATVHSERIETVVGALPPADIVSARALAPLPTLLDLASPQLLRGARGLFHKGRDYRQEVAATADKWQFNLVEHASLIADDSAVLDISELQRRT